MRAQVAATAAPTRFVGQLFWGEGALVLGEYVGLLVVLAAGIGLALVVLGVHLRLGPRRRFAAKQEPFECGEPQLTNPRGRFSVHFFLVAILFVVFDVEAVFFYPWAATFREVGWPGFIGIAVFAVPLVVGLLYEWSKGALDW